MSLIGDERRHLFALRTDFGRATEIGKIDGEGAADNF
jgi:hypothetical protein